MFSNVQENKTKAIWPTIIIFENLNMHTSSLCKAKQFRKDYTCILQQYRLSNFGILGPGHAHLPGKTGLGKTEENEWVFGNCQKLPSLFFPPLSAFYRIFRNTPCVQSPHWKCTSPPKAMEKFLFSSQTTSIMCPYTDLPQLTRVTFWWDMCKLKIL